MIDGVRIVIKGCLFSECSSGQFGKNCSEFCQGCISQMCDHVTGLCDNSTACKPGYVYDKYCNTGR